jgi:hypothetical protein
MDQLDRVSEDLGSQSRHLQHFKPDAHPPVMPAMSESSPAETLVLEIHRPDLASIWQTWSAELKLD